tara:strand:+ start:4312 stop:4818 length:507 start_codon:yes stop_codon:yes gene_type:complete
MDSNKFQATLFNQVHSADNSATNQALDYYKLCIAAAEQISSRRQSANSFFLTINTVLISFVSYSSIEELTINWTFFAVSFAGIAICLMWRRLILSYKELNSAKFKVILALEEKLPFKPYAAEWLSLGEGKNPAIHRPFSSMEAYVPLVFIFLHVFVIVLHVLTFLKPF